MNSRLVAMDSTIAAHAAPARNSKPPTGRAMIATPFTAACQSVTYRQVPLKLYGCEKIPSAAVGWRMAAAEICHKARIAPKLIIHPTIPMTRGARSLNGIVCHGRMGVFPATNKPSPTRCLLASAANHATDPASSESPAFHSPRLVVSAYRPLPVRTRQHRQLQNSRIPNRLLGFIAQFGLQCRWQYCAGACSCGFETRRCLAISLQPVVDLRQYYDRQENY